MTELAVMRRAAIIIGRAEQLFVGLGIVGADQRDQVVGRDHDLVAPLPAGPHTAPAIIPGPALP